VSVGLFDGTDDEGLDVTRRAMSAQWLIGDVFEQVSLGAAGFNA
jgi:hypothetical protein